MTTRPDLLAEFDAISLDALDERAALLRRVDNKYAVAQSDFAELTRRLRQDHQALEIEGRRLFEYTTTYFETPELRCLSDHIEDRVPRFKARTRLYEDSGECVFEVKLKQSEDETDKRQIDYRPEARRRLTEEAQRCLRGALEKAGLQPPEDLRPALTTSFRRATLVARDGSERLTCDFGVRLIGLDERTAQMRHSLVLIEAKSETGDSPADRELADIGVSPISLSKYRVGMSTVGGAERFGTQPGSELFDVSSSGRAGSERHR